MSVTLSKFFAPAVMLISLAGCAAPFSYAEDRCLGSYNQCRNSCPSIDSGPAQSACFERCLSRQSQCYAVGDDAVGSSLSQDALIGYSRSEAQKQADFEAWKSKKAREKAQEEQKAEEDAPGAP